MATTLNGNIFKEIDETDSSAQTFYTAPSSSGARVQISKLTLTYIWGSTGTTILSVHKVRNGCTANNTNVIYKVSVPSTVTTWQTVEFGEGHIMEASDFLAVDPGTATYLGDGCCITGSVVEIT